MKRNGNNKEINFSSYIKTRENVAYCLWVLKPGWRYLKVDGSGGLSNSGGPGKEVRMPWTLTGTRPGVNMGPLTLGNKKVGWRRCTMLRGKVGLPRMSLSGSK